MEAHSLKPYFIIILLLVLTSILLAVSVDVQVTDEAGIKIELPNRVGEWFGQQVFYCQNTACQKETRGVDLSIDKPCPYCGGKLDPMTLSEKALLPPDTVLLRKIYTNSAGEAIFSSIVLSGKERASIHRPQICLVGQGQEIVKSSILEVPMEGRGPLQIMVLDLIRRVHNPDGQMFELPSFYAYWFVGKGRETPYHIQRMVWMATDRIFYNRSHRWAYIAVAGMRQPTSDRYTKQVAAFVQKMYPQILLK